MITYEIKGGELSEKELEYYLERAENQHKGTTHMDITVDGDYVNVVYYVQPIERIRRVTGYLTGSVDRWNDAKRSELADRVKHGFDITDADRFND